MKCTILVLTLSCDCGRISRQRQSRLPFGLFILCYLLILLLISTFLLGMLILFRLRVEHLKMRSFLTGRCVFKEQRNARGNESCGQRHLNRLSRLQNFLSPSPSSTFLIFFWISQTLLSLNSTNKQSKQQHVQIVSFHLGHRLRCSSSFCSSHCQLHQPVSFVYSLLWETLSFIQFTWFE